VLRMRLKMSIRCMDKDHEFQGEGKTKDRKEQETGISDACFGYWIRGIPFRHDYTSAIP
jgi:hypothetical protein